MRSPDDRRKESTVGVTERARERERQKVGKADGGINESKGARRLRCEELHENAREKENEEEGKKWHCKKSAGQIFSLAVRPAFAGCDLSRFTSFRPTRQSAPPNNPARSRHSLSLSLYLSLYPSVSLLATSEPAFLPFFPQPPLFRPSISRQRRRFRSSSRRRTTPEYYNASSPKGGSWR